MLVFRTFGAVAQLGERCNRTAEVRGSIPLSSMASSRDVADVLPLGVTGNTPDSGSGESWFEPRRGNLKAQHYFGGVGPFHFCFTLPQFRRSFYRLLISFLGDAITASVDSSDVC